MPIRPSVAPPVSKADNFTAICEPILYTKCGSLNVSQPYEPPWPVTGIALPLQKLLKYFIFISKSGSYMRSEVLMAVDMNITVFWATTPCSFVGRRQRFGGICYFHLQSALKYGGSRFLRTLVHGVTSHKTVIFKAPRIHLPSLTFIFVSMHLLRFLQHVWSFQGFRGLL
jgi:hypothetical protein